MATTAEWIEELKGISVAELHERIRALEETFGVSAQSTVVPREPEPIEEEPEQTEFDVVLVSVPDPRGKIAVIKVVRVATGLGLKEAKALVDQAPVAIQKGLDAGRARVLREKLEAAGGTVEVR